SGPRTTKGGSSQMTANQMSLPAREWSSSRIMTVSMIWPTIGTKMMIKNKSVFAKQPLFCDIVSPPYNSRDNFFEHSCYVAFRCSRYSTTEVIYRLHLYPTQGNV